MALKSRFPAKKAKAVVSQWSCRFLMFLKMNWPSKPFEPTDSEHNFILLSERFNLTRVTLSMYVIASTEPLSGLGICQILPQWLVLDAKCRRVYEIRKRATPECEQPRLLGRCLSRHSLSSRFSS